MEKFEYCGKVLFNWEDWEESDTGDFNFYEVKFANNMGFAFSVGMNIDGNANVLFNENTSMAISAYELYKIIYWEEHYKQKEMKKITDAIELACHRNNLNFDVYILNFVNTNNFASTLLEVLEDDYTILLQQYRKPKSLKDLLLDSLKSAYNVYTDNTFELDSVMEQSPVLEALKECINFGFLEKLFEFKSNFIEN